MLKPSKISVELWETLWWDTDIRKDDSNPDLTYMADLGTPGDFYRGHSVSYAYMRNGSILSNSEVQQMLNLKSLGNTRDVENIMNGVDTVVYKYTIDKEIFDFDANFIIYNASNIHLYAAEIFANWLHNVNEINKVDLNKSLALLNNGGYKEVSDINQLGVRGRVGFGSADDAVYLENIIYLHDPYTNEISGYLNYTNNLAASQLYLEDQIITERARELAYSGSRFYDLIRVAKRRGDNAYLADKVAAKFSGARAEEIRNYLMNENNWYIPLPALELPAEE